METVHLLRHGEVYNPDRVLYGRLPGFRLSDLGIAQALLAAQFLATRDVGYLVASPLERAQQTAAPLAELTGLSVAADDDLIEAENFLEGRQVAGGRGLFRDPSNWKYFRNPVRPSWASRTSRLPAACCGPRRRRGSRWQAPARTPSASVTNSPLWRLGGRPKGCICSTIRASGSAAWPRLPP